MEALAITLGCEMMANKKLRNITKRVQLWFPRVYASDLTRIRVCRVQTLMLENKYQNTLAPLVRHFLELHQQSYEHHTLEKVTPYSNHLIQSHHIRSHDICYQASSEMPPRRTSYGAKITKRSYTQRLRCRVRKESRRRKERSLIVASQEKEYCMSPDPPPKKQKTADEKKAPTSFLDLPRELRQSVLDMTYSDSVFEHRTYADFVSADADSSELSYSHPHYVLAHANWVESIKDIRSDIAEDMEYVEEQWKKKYLHLNAAYIKWRIQSTRMEIRRRYAEGVMRQFVELNRQRYCLRSRSFESVQRRAWEVMDRELQEVGREDS